MRRTWTWFVLVMGLTCLDAGAVVAASPSPVASPGAAVASPGGVVTSPDVPPGSAVAECSDLVGLLADRIGDGLPLEATATSGVEGIDPDDLLDPFLHASGLGRNDVCGVVLRSADGAMSGMLLRFRGTGPDLADALAAALADRLRGYGQAVVEDRLELGGASVPRLVIGPGGSTTALLIVAATMDAVLLTGAPGLAEAVLEGMAASPGSPSHPPPAPASSADG